MQMSQVHALDARSAAGLLRALLFPWAPSPAILRTRFGFWASPPAVVAALSALGASSSAVLLSLFGFRAPSPAVFAALSALGMSSSAIIAALPTDGGPTCAVFWASACAVVGALFAFWASACAVVGALFAFWASACAVVTASGLALSGRPSLVIVTGTGLGPATTPAPLRLLGRRRAGGRLVLHCPLRRPRLARRTTASSVSGGHLGLGFENEIDQVLLAQGGEPRQVHLAGNLLQIGNRLFLEVCNSHDGNGYGWSPAPGRKRR
jgi:hypothetical protein